MGVFPKKERLTIYGGELTGMTFDDGRSMQYI